MILRGSSNHATGTLLYPFSDSPTREFDPITKRHHHPHLYFHFHNQSSQSHDLHHHKKNNFTPFCSSSLSEFNHRKGFRIAWSDSNLDRLLHPSSETEEFHSPLTPNKFPNGQLKIMLHSEPSLSVFNVNDEVEEKNGGEEEVLMRTVTIGESIEATASGDFSFGKKSMGLIEEQGENELEDSFNGIENLNLEQEKEPGSPPMYLASGLGIDGIDLGGSGGAYGGGGGGLSLPNFDESGDLEEYYKRMADEYPCHPLFLANYAQVLESKGELHGAEEYYHRASMADPEDGEILLKYAKLDWQLHHDQDRALSNFERASQAAPQDSHVLAAYASFLWEIDDDGEEDTLQPKHIQVEEEEILTKPDNNSTANQDFKPLINVSAGDDHNVEEYYKRMIEEYPSNSLVLRNYAQFLYQCKRDLPGAEEYYLRAVLADPGDGEIRSLYAKLIWELHRDQDKASTYFEQAVEAAPENSHVLAAYASFLWETEENEEDNTKPSSISRGCSP